MSHGVTGYLCESANVGEYADCLARLIADAGHELRTPLTSMRTNIELLVADEKSGMLPPGARAEILADVAVRPLPVHPP